MAFEDIDCVNPSVASGQKIPPQGVAVSVRRLGRPARAGGGHVSYIGLGIGAELAKTVSLTEPEHRLQLLFGTGEDAGQVRVSAGGVDGKFRAKRDKRGNYKLTINAATADGLFSLTFPAFTDPNCAAGQRHFVFQASAEMLAVEEEG